MNVILLQQDQLISIIMIVKEIMYYSRVVNGMLKIRREIIISIMRIGYLLQLIKQRRIM